MFDLTHGMLHLLTWINLLGILRTRQQHMTAPLAAQPRSSKRRDKAYKKKVQEQRLPAAQATPEAAQSAGCAESRTETEASSAKPLSATELLQASEAAVAELVVHAPSQLGLGLQQGAQNCGDNCSKRWHGASADV